MAQNSSSATGCSSATASSSTRRRRRASAEASAGKRTRSTTPVKPSSPPIGSCTTSGAGCSRARIEATAVSRSAPARSSLLTNAIRGTPCRSACRHTVSLCGSTPATASNTATAPSSTRSDRSTSAVKSTWPGVSMRVRRWPAHVQVTAAAKMVMPRSRSCGSKSVTVVPSWTSPVLWVVPVRWRIRSVTVVLPASTWARMPRLRTVVRGRLRTAVSFVDEVIGTARFPATGRQERVTEPGASRAAGTEDAKTPGSPRTASGKRQRCGDARPAPFVRRGGQVPGKVSDPHPTGQRIFRSHQACPPGHLA